MIDHHYMGLPSGECHGARQSDETAADDHDVGTRRLRADRWGCGRLFHRDCLAIIRMWMPVLRSISIPRAVVHELKPRRTAGVVFPEAGPSCSIAENLLMLRTIFSIGVFALVGLFLLSLIFNIMGALIGLAWWALVLAIKIAIVGFVVYLVIRVVSPNTARKLRERWGSR
jgi:hypothetical protein